ncbi:MAG TPA: ACP S-malonyltransferase [Candidatus Dormibacteraeota bacterium]|jgi:[acyl-carrier-protein] S-malonyltransferase|nr:ACP S-malonyltransferase [Candidatus Dormibacteraeota bacterium]
MTRVALTFPGQGSQAAGMAEGLLDAPLARPLLDAAAAHGLDLSAALAGDDDSLRPTEIAQPALLLVEAVLAGAVQRNAAVEVVGVAGHSVGEYAALVVAGALDPAEAMGLVVERGRAMAAMQQGGMAALLGAEESLADEVCREVRDSGGGTVVVANLNAPGQVVLSGDRGALDRAIALARERGVRRAMPLNVSGAFHSPLMAPAAERFAALLDAATFRDATIPVACNVDGAAVTDAAGLRDRLRRQLTAPVRWVDCVATLVALGAESLVEVGPGSVLSGLARRIAPQVPALSLARLDGAAALADTLAGARG